MATKEERAGLLSKVAMFVRNPTKDWAELDQPADSESSGYDKQALKAMIERKKQNDFVRKREFDQLRKLRNRDPGALASMARPSFFQTSLPTDMDGRAVTLKKIDEIEAQMSRQWWKAKAQDSQASTAPAPEDQVTQKPPDLLPEDSQAYQAPSDLSTPFAPTEPLYGKPVEAAAALDAMQEFAATQMAPGAALVEPEGMDTRELDEARREASVAFSASRMFAIEVDEMATDPELEEAAIRFANGDDAGAESGLLTALRGPDLVPQAAQSWAAALLDFYRATGNRPAFETAANEFALYLDGAWPVWAALGEGATKGAGAASVDNSRAPVWNCPAQLTAKGMEAMRLAMVSNPMPWHLRWTDLQAIAPDAVPLLEALFASLCEEAVTLRFDGEDRLTRALRALTPSGGRDVDRSWWQLRLNALRAMAMQDDFELAALDYCITFEASPPEWTSPPCRIDCSGAAAALAAQAPDFSHRTVPMDVGTAETGPSLVLRGEILGDASQALEVLDAGRGTGVRMSINCSDLVRVDFAAAGSILNWVGMRQAEGKQVQFQSVHRLVAAFFHVIGINENAKVIPRSI